MDDRLVSSLWDIQVLNVLQNRSVFLKNLFFSRYGVPGVCAY